MNEKQETIIIILLAAILSVLLAGRAAAIELLGNLFWVVVAVFIVAVLAFAMRAFILHLQTAARAKNLKKLKDEIEQLCREISTCPGPQLTSEHIPQRFPSKEAAQAFGANWSRGGPDSFSVNAVDAQGWIEWQPSFDKTSISGGMLFTKPALFFGMPEAHREDDGTSISASPRSAGLQTIVII